MKNLLILIVAAALFLHFYPQPKLEDWFGEQKDTVLEVFSGATDTQIRLKADKIYTDLEEQFEHFSTEEQEFLQNITTDRESVKAFFVEFCEGKQRSPQLHTENQKKVCDKIGEFSALF